MAACRLIFRAHVVSGKSSFGRRCHESATCQTTSAAAVKHKRWSSQHRVVLLPEVPSDTSSTNPILCPHTGGLPELRTATERHCYFGLGKAVLEFEAAVAEMEAKCEEGVRDFSSLFAPLESARLQMESVWSSVNLLHVTTDFLDRDRFVGLQRRAEAALLARHDSRAIFAALREMKSAHAKEPHLSSEEERILDRYLIEYKHQGYELRAKKYDELRTNWMRRLGEAKREYSFKIATATDRFRHTIRDPNIVRDFPVDVLRAMSADSAQPSKGPWTVTLHPYIYRKFMAHCPNRNLRWNAYQAHVGRGSRSFDVNLNVANHAKEIREFRLDQALTLGYVNYAEMSMDTKMAGTTENVHSMIASLLGPAKQGQERELEAVQEYAESRGFDEEITLFDVDFFARKQKRSILGVSDEDVRDFFPLPKVLSGLFRLLRDLFDVDIAEISMASDDIRWHPDVSLYTVVDAAPDSSGSELGQFFLDPYIRDDKGYNGADSGWYVPMRLSSEVGGGKSVGALVLALPAPAYGKPSLLNLAEVEELLRQLGHMLQHVLATSRWTDVRGRCGVEWDAQDVPAHFMAHFLTVPDVLQSCSGHWSSAEPLPAKLLGPLADSKHHMAGLKLSRELYKAAYDIAFYTEDYDKEHYQEIATRLHPQYLAFPKSKDDAFPLYFSEMLGGDMPAAYFSGTWARMLAADAFSAIHEVGFDNTHELKKITKRFRASFLSLGSSLPAAEVFRKFRGRDPSHEALLLSLGLKNIPHPKQKGQLSN